MENLAAWFHNADLVIKSVIQSTHGSSPVRCWPHHFDIASLITLDPDVDAEQARSIGVGLSPGDGSYDQPYFYVTPWPYPAVQTLPALGSFGAWHTEGWTGAILTAETIIPSADQETVVREFLRDAIGACRKALDSR